MNGNNGDSEKKKNREGIQWHPAFVEALQATLIDYSDVLEYKLEHPLNTGPLRIDILVVKKRPEAVIRRQIAGIFRLDNIVEYKSPTDTLSVNEFHKAFARAHLYKALADVDVTDLTLSFVIAAHPRELFRHLRGTLGYAVQERHPGVFVVTGAMMPIQIIDIRKLSEEENLWLQNLNRNLSGERLRWIHNMKRECGMRLNLGAYLHAVFTANQETLKELLSKEEYRMLTAEMCKTLEEIGWGEKWRQEGRQEGLQKGLQKGLQEGFEEGRLKDARAMFAEGDSLEKIARITEIPLETLKAKLFLQ